MTTRLEGESPAEPSHVQFVGSPEVRPPEGIGWRARLLLSRFFAPLG
ncbi:MAG: hypothetical protein NZ741_04910 [Armatimonadetes bacterium]|nr:hypothetical protein [Armatimonadota bacterium]